MPATDARPKGLVLVAEDVKIISRKMILGLEQCGYKVALAEDGEQCLEMARSLKPSLVILDIMMPKIHGIEVLKQLRADPATHNLGVVICTAKSFGTELSYAATLGAYGFLIKPFRMTDLTGMVNGYFESHGGGTPAVGSPRGGGGDISADSPDTCQMPHSVGHTRLDPHARRQLSPAWRGNLLHGRHDGKHRLHP